MQQLELSLQITKLPDECPNCGFGERVDFAGDEHYTSGYFYVCDCGYSVGMEPTFSYDQYKVQIDLIRSQRRAILHQIQALDQSIKKLSEFIGDCVEASARKMQSKRKTLLSARDFMADGRDWESIAPKSNKKRRVLSQDKDDLERQSQRLWEAWLTLRKQYPHYAYLHDNE